MSATVFVDAENVRRSTWPNVSRERLVELLDEWAEANATDVVVVFDGPPPATAPRLVRVEGTPRGETADERLVRKARERHELGERIWVVTSDRGLRQLVDPHVERTIGGGSFLRELLGRRQ